MVNSAAFHLLESPEWRDYELLDSGDGLKLERFGSYTFIRPEVQAMWRRALPAKDWAAAQAVFQPSGEESGGHWAFRTEIADRWQMKYPLGAAGVDLRFWAMTTPGRHLGVFPEVAAHWDFMAGILRGAGRPAKVLNLFGYTGLASLAAAAAGAQVTHVDASKRSVAWARENQELSGLSEKPIRWIVDDALKFVQREVRRGVRYDGILLDPPKFGRGPKGEVWELFDSLPTLLEACGQVLSDTPCFAILTLYSVKASAVHAGQTLQELMGRFRGSVTLGELVARERGGGRLLSQAVFARWQAD
jgi:23S rRNA (cytosine1962-C5)-methyltransferase